MGLVAGDALDKGIGDELLQDLGVIEDVALHVTHDRTCT